MTNVRPYQDYLDDRAQESVREPGREDPDRPRRRQAFFMRRLDSYIAGGDASMPGPREWEVSRQHGPGPAPSAIGMLDELIADEVAHGTQEFWVSDPAKGNWRQLDPVALAEFGRQREA